MCNYNDESRKALIATGGTPRRVYRRLSSRARRPLLRLLEQGGVRQGRDLMDGRRLPEDGLRRGHYMAPPNYRRLLDRMDRDPEHCQWCGGRLPLRQVSRHLRPHNHREEIAHHFHQGDCWTARLLALAVLFGHAHPSDLVPGWRGRPSRRSRRARSTRGGLHEKVEVTVKRTRRWWRSRRGLETR